MEEFNPQKNTENSVGQEFKNFLENLQDLSQDKEKIMSFVKGASTFYPDKPNWTPKGTYDESHWGTGKNTTKKEKYRIGKVSEPKFSTDGKIALVPLVEAFASGKQGDWNHTTTKGGIILVIKQENILLAADPGDDETNFTIDGGWTGNDGADAPSIKDVTLNDDGLIVFNQHKAWTMDTYERSIDLKKIKFSGQDYQSLSKKS